MVGVADFFNDITNFLSGDAGVILTLLFFTAVIIIYSIFVFYFYRFLARKNIIELNLHQYNTHSKPGFAKMIAALLYFLEYIILLPIVTFFWFVILAIILLVLAEGISLETVLFISAALVASVRATSYVNEDLAKDLAKMIPFTLLAIAITKPGFFDVSLLFTRILEISTLFSNILYYLGFIIIFELIMRMLDFTNNLFGERISE